MAAVATRKLTTTAACLLCLLALTQLLSPAAAASAAAASTRTARRLLGTNQRGPGGLGGGVCACPRIYAPVCGTDGVAYNTRCEAECRGVSVTGQRPLNGVCNSGPDGPVNPAGPGFVPSGPSSTRPWFQSAPGSNPQWGSNPQADSLPALSTPIIPPQASNPRPAPVRPNTNGGQRVCPCPLIYAPVCGADGKSYATKCAADCVGVSIASQGNCPGQGA